MQLPKQLRPGSAFLLRCMPTAMFWFWTHKKIQCFMFFHHQGSLQTLKHFFFSASAKHFISFSFSSGPPPQIGTLHFCWTAYCRGDTVPSRKTSSISTKRGLTSSNSLSRFVKRHVWGRFGSGIEGVSTSRVKPLMDFAHGNYWHLSWSFHILSVGILADNPTIRSWKALGEISRPPVHERRYVATICRWAPETVTSSGSERKQNDSPWRSYESLSESNFLMKYATHQIWCQVAPKSHSSRPVQQRLAESPHRIRTHIVMDHKENEGKIESGPSTSWVLPISFQSPQGG